MKKTFKIILIILGILLLLYILFISIPYILNTFAKDIPNVDETGLQINNPNLPYSANAYFDLNQLSGVVYLPANKDDANIISNIVTATSGDVWNDSLVKDVISKNSKVLEIISDASNKSDLYDPRYSDLSKISPDMILTNLNDWRNAGKITSLDALYQLKQGKNIDAMDEAIKTIKVGYLVSESNQTLIGYLVGVAIKSMGYNVASEIINQSHFNQIQKQNYLTKLNALADNGRGLKNAFIIEYHNQKNGFNANKDEIISQNVDPNYSYALSHGSYYYQPNKTMQYFADYARDEIGNIDTNCEITPNITNIKLIEPISYLKVYFTENAIGKTLHDVVSTSLSSVLNKRCEYNARLLKVTQLLSNNN